MKKIIAALCLMLVTAWSVFAIATHQYENALAVNASGVPTSETSVERVVLSQEDAQVAAIDQVSDAVVGIVNLVGQTAQGEGSGVVYKTADGDTYIVTNDHVVSGGEDFEVVFANGDRYPGELVGTDPYTDLAVLKIKGFTAPTVAVFGNTEDLKIGQTVIAIGNPLGLDFAGSATSGIVSGQDRTVSVQVGAQQENWEMTVLQTDTSINPGNSGGALINLAGEVVGINSMKIASSSVEGMSFSIPTYVALPIIEDLEAYGQVVRPVLGVGIFDLATIPDRFRTAMKIPTDVTTGIFVDSVADDSLAKEMGIEAGDLIIAIGDKTVETGTQFKKELFTYREGDKLEITVLRAGEEMTVQTTLK